jgi:hypothetical protein
MLPAQPIEVGEARRVESQAQDQGLHQHGPPPVSGSEHMKRPLPFPVSSPMKFHTLNGARNPD